MSPNASMQCTKSCQVDLFLLITTPIRTSQRIPQREPPQKLLRAPRPCAMAMTRTLHMCELTDKAVLQMPRTCPWCQNDVAITTWSLYSQIIVHFDHLTSWGSCVHTYTGVKASDGRVSLQMIPKTLLLLLVGFQVEKSSVWTDAGVDQNFQKNLGGIDAYEFQRECVWTCFQKNKMGGPMAWTVRQRFPRG